MLRGLRIIRQQGTRLTVRGDHQRITRTRRSHIQQRAFLLQRSHTIVVGKTFGDRRKLVIEQIHEHIAGCELGDSGD